jgi:NAD(P)-dependent dehydrogenase (short-subunit alcohol dehydrogenase family)
MSVNLGGVVNGVKIITPQIIGHGEGGHIVNTASMAGIVPNPIPGLGAYMTAKFAVRGFTESLRISIDHHGIGVSCLCPGGTRTRIMDEGKKRDAQARRMIEDLLASSMDPIELGAMVVEGIRNNAPYILTHAEFRDEVREIHAMLDAAFPRNQHVPEGRAAFEEHRRSIIARARAQPVKD